MKNYLVAGAVVLAAALVGIFAWQNATAPAVREGEDRLETVTYMCDGERTITATYFDGAVAPAPEPGEPPVLTGTVEVSLDGGAVMTLTQTISASGIRYANEDESFVFWSKGSEALIMRDNSMDLTYTNCRAAGA